MEHGQGGHAGYHGDAYHSEQHSPIGHGDAYVPAHHVRGGHYNGAPHGHMIHGVAGGGHEYIEGHTGGHHWLAPRGIFGGRFGNEPFVDQLTLAIAIDLAFGHGGTLEGYQHGSLTAIPAFAGTEGGQHNSDQAKRFNIPGIARDAYAVELLVWPHAEKWDAQEALRKYATRGGMTRIHPGPIDGNTDIDRTVAKLLSNTPFGDADDEVNVPNGWHNSARGTTHVWREYFQLQPCSWGPLKALLGNPNWDPWRTYLIVSGATWRFLDPRRRRNPMRKVENDRTFCTTRISLSVWSKYLVVNKRPTWRFEEIYDHRKMSEWIAKNALEEGERHPAPGSAINFILSLPPESLTPPVKPDPLALSPADWEFIGAPIGFNPGDLQDPGANSPPFAPPPAVLPTVGTTTGGATGGQTPPGVTPPGGVPVAR